MSVYLHDIPLPEALGRFEEALKSIGRWGSLETETIPLDEHALGRVVGAPVWARISSPHYHAAAMDGFAVRARDTDGALQTAPVRLECSAQALYMDTGDPLPDWANAVIPIENVEPIDESGGMADDLRGPAYIRIRAAVAPWRHVRTLGEDIVATQLVLPIGHRLRPIDLGAVAACGHKQVEVTRLPKVAILPTGTELVPVGSEVKPGDIIEFNSIVLAAQICDWGGEPTRYAVTSDDFEAIKGRVVQAARYHDLILLNAGSSAGAEDFSAQVVQSLGDLLVHGVAVRPGHPVILGLVRIQTQENGHNSGEQRAVPIIGVPGYPVSAALTGEIFVKPLLERWQGLRPQPPNVVRASLTRKVTSPSGDDDYMRVALGRVGGRLLAAPLSRGAGVITSLVRADGLAILPRGSQGLKAGAEVEVQLYRPQSEIETTIFAIGSHDITLDLMAQYLAPRGRRLASANVGSLGGLVALRRREAHLAGSHLLDPERGEYNLAYVRQYLSGQPVILVALVGREQGLMVKKGNPLHIHSWEDLARPEVTFINRQRGAGTRVLLDYQLGILGIEPESVGGYNQEEYTHLGVAAAVASGRANCGLGIAAAAQALELDFVPLSQERYDLVIPEDYYHSELLAPLLDLLEEPDFRQAVASMPGYDIEPMGRVIAEINS
jgi:putative molybdopterin biosynthesis protein